MATLEPPSPASPGVTSHDRFSDLSSMPTPRTRCFTGSCLGSHSAADAGTSHWLSPFLLLPTRAMSSATLIFFVVDQVIHAPPFIYTIFAWTTIIQAGAFLLLAGCSAAATGGRRARALSTAAALLYQVGSTLSLVSIPFGVFGYRSKFNVFYAMRFLPTLVLFLLDTLVLGARVQFRFRCVWAVYLVLCANASLIAVALVKSKSIPVPSREVGLLVLAIIVILIWVMLATALLIAVMSLPARLSAHMAEKRKQRDLAAMDPNGILNNV